MDFIAVIGIVAVLMQPKQIEEKESACNAKRNVGSKRVERLTAGDLAAPRLWMKDWISFFAIPSFIKQKCPSAIHACACIAICTLKA